MEVVLPEGFAWGHLLKDLLIIVANMDGSGVVVMDGTRGYMAYFMK